MPRKFTAAPAPSPSAEGVVQPLTATDKITAFRTATRGLPKHFAKEIRAGMTDAQLQDALARTLGIWGGCSGPGDLDVSFQGAGLRIWASWGFCSQKAKPVFSGPATLAMARTVYGIRNPQDHQLRLF